MILHDFQDLQGCQEALQGSNRASDCILLEWGTHEGCVAVYAIGVAAFAANMDLNGVKRSGCRVRSSRGFKKSTHVRRNPETMLDRREQPACWRLSRVRLLLSTVWWTQWMNPAARCQGNKGLTLLLWICKVFPGICFRIPLFLLCCDFTWFHGII